MRSILRFRSLLSTGAKHGSLLTTQSDGIGRPQECHIFTWQTNHPQPQVYHPPKRSDLSMRTLLEDPNRRPSRLGPCTLGAASARTALRLLLLLVASLRL